MTILKYLTAAIILILLGGQYVQAEDEIQKNELCGKHKLKTTECFICDSSLRIKGRLWCKEHDRYEDRCWICHSNLEDKNRIFCKEHSLYEDECYFCHPDSTKALALKNQSLNTKISMDKCNKHGLSKGVCFICDPALRKKGRLWCKEHERYEDRCWKCHSELEDKNRPFCKEHNLYEDECIFCNPNNDLKEASNTKPSSVLICDEHKVPEQECGICQPQLAKNLKPGESMKIRLATENSVNKAGIKTALASESISVSYIKVYSQVSYNKSTYAHISPLASGVVKKVLVNVGDDVDEGDVIAEIYSITIADAKSAYLASISDYKLKEESHTRKEKLFQNKVSSIRELQESRSSYEKAYFEKQSSRQRLLNYGFSPNEIDHIVNTRDTSSLLVIKAPFQGKILDRNVVVGELKSMGEILFILGDLSNMWLELTIPEDQASMVEQGQKVDASFMSSYSIQSKGEIVWVDTLVDENSRMVKARAVIPNTKGTLKAGIFGYANIIFDIPKKSLRIPKGAVHELENQPFVFVKVKDDLFDLRRVEIGYKNNNYVDVTDGINENESIVVVGKFTMVSEYLKSRLGAGCVDD